jgi:polyphosphate kinase
VKALARAAENGKQVTAIVELKARFDEASNIEWARTLEQSGAQVIYGLLGLKTHVKALLVLRREKDNRLRRYVHLSTGNYNPQTARFYTDVGLFTANREIGEDVTSLFNLLTGYSAPRAGTASWSRRSGSTRRSSGSSRARPTTRAPARRPLIVAQMNSLVDVDVIDALYAASQAGVEIRSWSAGSAASGPASRALRSHLGARDHRSLPGARAHVPLRQRGERGGVHLERRLDAAQLPPARGAARPASSIPPCASGSSTRSICSSPTP